jgi:hypothetical protein
MKLKLHTLAGLVALAGVALAWAEPNWLITPDEVNQEAVWRASNPEPVMFRPKNVSPGRPVIEMVAPASLAEPIKTPFPIRIAFKAKDGATIKPETFQALYGFLKIDITERLTGKAKVTREGIDVESAAIPSGNHRLVLRVSDDKDRQGETEIRFSVQ